MKLFGWFSPSPGKKPTDYGRYATGVLQELINATPMQEESRPPYLHSVVSFWRDNEGEDGTVLNTALNFGKQVEAILCKVTGAHVYSLPRHDPGYPGYYHVEFKAPLPLGMTMDAFKDKLREAMKDREIPAQLQR